jgi:branched-chain amino acid transport system ATP-binding protein
MLQVRKVSAGYGADPVLHNVDMDVQKGEIVTLIGANGAGKSTLVKTISGLLKPMGGQIFYEGKQIDGLSPADRVRLGISHVPEGRQVFAGLTVAENLRMGAYAHRKARSEAEISQRMKEVCRIFPILEERMGNLAGNFSGGQQQMLAIARGLMSSPRLLVLDEPSLGLSPLLVSEIFALIGRLREQGLAILLSEQNARSALQLADRGYVMENGAIALAGPASELLHSPEIAERYLGVGGATRFSEEHSARMAAQLRVLIGTDQESVT